MQDITTNKNNNKKKRIRTIYVYKRSYLSFIMIKAKQKMIRISIKKA